jgi:membrane associated rhomboid family serine protease
MRLRITQTQKWLLGIYIGIFLLQNLGLKSLFYYFALTPDQFFHGCLWQLLTYNFIHADPMHLVLNLIVLVFVGSDIEGVWGRKKTLFYYFYCSVMAGLVYLLIPIFAPEYAHFPLVGASGGIYGLLLAYGILWPDREMLFMMLFPMNAKVFTLLIAGVEFLQILSSTGSGKLGAVAHLSGMGAGYVYLYLQAKGFQFRKSTQGKSSRKGSHLRLVKTNRNEDDDAPGPKTWH